MTYFEEVQGVVEELVERRAAALYSALRLELKGEDASDANGAARLYSEKLRMEAEGLAEETGWRAELFLAQMYMDTATALEGILKGPMMLRFYDEVAKIAEAAKGEQQMARTLLEHRN